MPEGGEYEIHDTGNTAMALAMAIELQPDIVVLDYHMPEKDGLQLAVEMRAAGVNSKYILLTANTQETIGDAAIEQTFVAVIEKPINHESIAEILKKTG